jgi:hypothetical protein
LGDEILTLAQLADGTLGTGNDRHVLPNSRSARRHLVSKSIDDLGCGTDEDHSVLLDLAGEFGVLREESVTFRDQLFFLPLGAPLLTRVDHVDAVLDSNLDDLIDSEVSLNRRVLSPLSNHVGLVRLC